MHLSIGASTCQVIGASTAGTAPFMKWKETLLNNKFTTIEINRRRSNLPLNTQKLSFLKKELLECKLSIHSITDIVFCDNPVFTKGGLAELRAEIIAAKEIGAKEVVFHPSDRRITDKEQESLSEVVKTANENGINLLLENDSRDHFSKSENILQVIRNTGVGLVLDLGHLNKAVCSSGVQLDSFLNQIRDYVTYLHVSNNNGQVDEHNSILKGTLNYERVIKSLDLERVKKAIIETRSLADALETREALEKLFVRI